MTTTSSTRESAQLAPTGDFAAASSALARAAGWARAVWPHIVMILVMAGVMLGPWGALGSLAGAALLIATSVCCAPIARSDGAYRAHIVDLWAMAVLILALLPAVGSQSSMAMGSGQDGTMSMPLATGAGTPLVPVILVWAAVRAVVAVFSSRQLHDAVTAAVTAMGLVAMIAL